MVWRRGSVNPFAFLANIRAVRRIYRTIEPDLVHHVARAADDRRFAGGRRPAVRAAQRAGRARLCLHVGHAKGAIWCGRFCARCCGMCLATRARRCWCKTPTTARRSAASALPTRSIFVIARLWRRNRQADAAAGAGRADHRGVCRPPARRQGRTHAGRRARNSRAPRSIDPAADRRRARSGQSGFDSAGRRSRRGRSIRASRCSAMCRTSARSGRRRTSPCCRRGARACRRACWRRRPAAGRSSPPTFPAAARSRGTDVNALLVPPDDPAALADAIERLANDRRCGGGSARRGADWSKSEFSSDRIGQETVALYDRLLGRLRP